MNKARYFTKNILVVGDVMLDFYHTGSINRISPEAPIPVFDEEETKTVLGGAGNVALNIKSLLPEYNVDLLTVISQQQIYLNDLKGVNIIHAGFLQRLIEKHRFIDKRNNQQIGLRHDIFYNRYKLKENAINYLKDKNYDMIVFSDYDKGTFDNYEFVQDLLQKAEKDGSRTILDSKSSNLSKFKGIDIFKPNNKEYEIYLKNKTFDFTFVVRTESENGMTLYNNVDKEMLHFPSYVKDIVSSVGAGDTALAGLVWGISIGRGIDIAMKYANFLAGQSCLHPGTYVVTQEDLDKAGKSIDKFKDILVTEY